MMFVKIGGMEMGKEYGYVRISRKTQKIERQVENIKRLYPNAKIFSETFTGRKITGRKEFNRLLKIVESGDTIIFDSVSRMSRNAEEGTTLYFELFDKGINLVFIKESYINTSTYKEALQNEIELTGDIVDDILVGVNSYLKKLAKKQINIAFEQAEKEVEDLRLRTSEGLREAKRKGKQIGQFKGAKYKVKKKDEAMIQIQKHSRSFTGSLTDKDVIKLIGISENTYYKYKKELTEKLIAEQAL